MARNISIEQFLEANRVPFIEFRHFPAFTAQEEAAASHVRGRDWAKTVVCIVDGEPVLAVVPAPYRIDLEELRRLARGQTIRLATEDELAGFYPGCEVGAMPPLGSLYHQRVFIDRCLAGNNALVFEAGAHSKAICMQYNDFASITHPVVGWFGRPNWRQRRLPRQ